MVIEEELLTLRRKIIGLEKLLEAESNWLCRDELNHLPVNTLLEVYSENKLASPARRYFSHIDEDGDIYCFKFGATSESTDDGGSYGVWQKAKIGSCRGRKSVLQWYKNIGEVPEAGLVLVYYANGETAYGHTLCFNWRAKTGDLVIERYAVVEV